MFTLDIRTLSLTTMLFSLIFFIGLLVFTFSNKRFKGLQYFAYANLSLFLGFLFISLRDLVPQFLSIVIANFLLAFAFFLYYYGSVSFLKQRFMFRWLHFSGLFLLILSLAYFTYIDVNVNNRILIINSFLFIESIGIAVFFIKQSSYQFRVPKLSVAYGFIIYGLYSLIRVIWTLGESRIDDFLQDGIIYGLVFIFILVLIVNTAFSVIWIANSILNYDLETQAKIDPLTKVLNRRAFVDELTKEIARSKRESLTFSLIMADIDHFKNINDENGHLAGDSVLITFTRMVVENLRISDILSRFGGEEFIIILPNTNKKYAFETAERIRKIVEMGRHPFNGKNIAYTVSLGVASFDLESQNKEELLENVDEALYKAKTNGRNRVEST
ncbi:MAG: GGDEF domain-containing protein [Spirochaetaceae bacterium]|jgi:diguanylate cyclase (GGDEF)-like protein|nr:GGDEF domain-containing protein [Spirochaetaceae bacterium]